MDESLKKNGDQIIPDLWQSTELKGNPRQSNSKAIQGNQKAIQGKPTHRQYKAIQGNPGYNKKKIAKLL
jgi:hypothetical protein